MLLHSRRHKIEFISTIPLLYFFDFMKATEKKKKEKEKKKITNPVTMNFVPHCNENVNFTQHHFSTISSCPSHSKAFTKSVFHVDQNYL